MYVDTRHKEPQVEELEFILKKKESRNKSSIKKELLLRIKK
jgi:hypothetical protein